MATATRWWHKRDDQIVCDLCPRECALHEGQRGFCFVRQNVGGEMALTTYGRSSGFCIDPVEKKPLNQFLPGTPILSFGTAGCNLGCKFCQNWSISKAKEFDTLADSADPAAIARAAKNSGCRSVAFTYNDPVIWAEYAIDTAIACHELGIKTVAVTAGYISPEARKDFYAVMDAANVDLKGFTESFYKYLTLSRLDPVLDTLKWLKHESNVWFEITNLMIPGENDSAEETAKMCDWIVRELGTDVPVHFTAFHPDFRMQDKPRTPAETLNRARQQAIDAGIKFAYVGNVHDVAGQSTYCPKCGTLLIQRDWYQLGTYQLVGNRCAKCSEIIPGVFEDRPGTWGAKRQPIRISPPVVQLTPPSRPVVVSSVPATRPSTPAQTTMLPQLPDSAPLTLTDDDSSVIVAYARAAVESALLTTPAPQLPESLASLPTYGIFVTLKRAVLRACKGRFGDISRLGDILPEVAADAVTHDPRFPSIMADELPRLQVEVSLMHGPQWINARGDERIRAVQVGKHGLVLHHPRGRGLLLPQVAADQNMDSLTFLKALSHKAGLPMDAWRDDAAQLMTFEATILHSEPPVSELNAVELPTAMYDRIAKIVVDVMRGESLDAGGLDRALTEVHSEELGLAARTKSGRITVTLGQKRSLSEMASAAGRSLRQSLPKDSRSAELLDSVSLLWQPIPLVPRDFPQRHQTLAGSALVARRNGGQWGLHLTQAADQGNFQAALQSVGSDLQQWGQPSGDTTLTAFSVRHHMTGAATAPSQPVAMVASNAVRLAARAGQFYPATAAEMKDAITRALAEGNGTRETFRAIMLPHAGWVYCGSVIGRTLSRTNVPRTVIIVGPKHTPFGANWSVSSAESWEFPGGSVPVATEIRDRLLALVPGLAAESEAHRQEHGIEVLVPFLHHLNPDLRIVPIVIGPSAYSQTHLLARALAIVVAELPEPPLLVISSDMNHFASEPENRRLDQLAIDAMCTGDPGRLFDVVSQHNISMCGVMPAVTIMRALREGGRDLRPELVHYTNSGQVSGQHDRVVGYAGMVLR